MFGVSNFPEQKNWTVEKNIQENDTLKLTEWLKKFIIIYNKKSHSSTLITYLQSRSVFVTSEGSRFSITGIFLIWKFNCNAQNQILYYVAKIKDSSKVTLFSLSERIFNRGHKVPLFEYKAHVFILASRTQFLTSISWKTILIFLFFPFNFTFCNCWHNT